MSDPIITSPANDRLKHVRRVREGREPEWIFVEGERLIEECLQSGLDLFACFHIPHPSPRSLAIIEEIKRRGVAIFPTSDEVLATISDTVNSQGLIVIAQRPRYDLSEALSRRDGEKQLIVCLDAVQDPGNFGTITRTAEAAGAGGILALKGCVEPFAPKTLRSSMGAAFRLPIIADVEVEKLISAARRKGITAVAATADGETVYSDYDWRIPTLAIFGNEARGVSKEILERSDLRLRIPLRAPVESLNVAAAAAAILFEAARQRSKL